jgi:ketosteroid isomerase-like protein
MAEKENIAVVQQAYAAFQRGDIAAILALVGKDVEWEGVKGAPASVAFSGLRRGRPAVEEFFALVVREEEFTRFEPKEFFANGDRVVALGSYSARVKRTGKSFSGDWAMAFTVRDGLIVKFVEYADTYGIAAAF